MKLRFRNYLRLLAVFFLLYAQPGLADFVVGSDGEVVVNLREPGVTPLLLAESILGSGVEVQNVEFTGAASQAGFVSAYDLLGFSEGVILGNGDILHVLGPNDEDSTSSIVFDQNIEDGDFYELNGRQFTRDSSIIELDFIAPENQSQLVIEYIFGSDEYAADTSQLVDGAHDFMAIFVNGQNCATVLVGDEGVEKVGVSSINHESNSDLYIDNVRTKPRFFGDYTSPYNTEMDGFTQVLKCSAPIVAGASNHLEFGIVDASSGPIKGGVDSWVILKAVYTDRFLDSDGDGTPNYDDNDDDNDGIPDSVEGNYDIDGDGLPNGLDADSDGDGDSDSSECPDASDCSDSDGDGIPDFVDIADRGNGAGDSDDDGISDDVECSTPSNSGKDCADHDSDLTPDYSDADSNNNGIGDKEECADAGTGCVDSNSDGIPDYLDVDSGDDADDTDSDGDGISDRDECSNEIEVCPDSDGDGISDYRDAVDGSADDDNDGDGLTNGTECPEQRFCPDSDGDGLADYSDADSNNNGTGDKEECADTGTGCVDSNNDGIPDYLDVDDTDSDGDGISDRDECSNEIEACPDSDGDGLSDYLDAVNGSADDDNDGDGLTNGDECPEQRFCPDSDGDGLADYEDVDTPADADEDNTGADPRTVGDNNGATDQRVKVGVDGVGAFNPMLLGLLFLSLGLRTVTSMRRSFFSSATMGALALGLFAFTQNEQAVAADGADQEGYEGFYVGLSLGQSTLEPDVSASPYTLDEDGGLGIKVSAGYDLTDSFSVEGALALLGEAELSPSASIEYQPLYVSGVYHLLGQRSRSVFIRAGLATLNISSSIPVNEENDYQLMLGFGGEWALDKGWSARAEIESFDEDASLLSVGIVKRFGRKTQDVAELDMGPSLMGEGTVSEFDTTEEEICSDISMEVGCFIPTIEEQEDSCAVVAGRIEGIHFELNKADLTPSAIAVLDEAASVLKTCPSFKVEIQAYADNVGSKERNLVLSRHRAHTVQLHLAARGISLSRLLSRGFGENNPVADNSTKEGRALNRRVEFNLMKIGGRKPISSDE